MWRQKPFHENHDSDHSISDEEELDGVIPENVVSLNTSARSKEELPLPVRLDFLRGTREQNLIGKDSISSFEKLTGLPLEDEVEMPDFEEGNFSRLSGEVVANSSDEEIISEDEKGIPFLSKFIIGSHSRELHKYGPGFIRNEQTRDFIEESEAVLCNKKSASCSASHAGCSKANRSDEGIWSKAKPVSSMRLLSDNCEPFGPSIFNCHKSVLFKVNRLHETMEDIDPWAFANSVGNNLEAGDTVEKDSEIEPAEVEAIAHGFNVHSVADLFDNIQNKTNLNLRHRSQRRERRVQLFANRIASHLQDRIVSSEDSPEPLSSGSSSDNEVNDQKTEVAYTEKRMQTMADRFQEALGASSVIDKGSPKPFRAGIFGNLQQVMQKEKERDMDFWKKLQTGASLDSELGSLDVKILSRYLDAKLTVCHCSSGKYRELADNSKGNVHDSWERTIIFSPRVCNNVDLEIGNLIRIHPPWNEVQVGNDSIIILCTYFSQIS